METSSIMKIFLRKLINRDIWGGKHTEITNLTKALPKHLRGTPAAKEAVKELVQKGFIHLKKSTGEVHISLNIEKKQGIYEFLQS